MKITLLNTWYTIFPFIYLSNEINFIKIKKTKNEKKRKDRLKYKRKQKERHSYYLSNIIYPTKCYSHRIRARTMHSESDSLVLYCASYELRYH